MPSMSLVSIVGHVGRDPEQRFTQSGQKVATFSVAVGVGRKQADNTYSDETDWYRVTLFGQQAEYAERAVSKGSLVRVDGRLRLDHWTSQAGEARTTLDIAGQTLLVFPAAPKQDPGERAVQPKAGPRDLEDLPF